MLEAEEKGALPDVDLGIARDDEGAVWLLERHEERVHLLSARALHSVRALFPTSNAHLSIWSQPPSGPGRPAMASAETLAYVARICGNWFGPPPKPPSGCWYFMIVLIALRATVSSYTPNSHALCTHRCLLAGSSPTPSSAKDCRIQNMIHALLASCAWNLAGRPCSNDRPRKLTCAFRSSNGASSLNSSDISFSVSSCSFDVAVGSESTGVGRKSGMVEAVRQWAEF